MIPIHNILFLDIETVPQYPSFDKLPDQWQELWKKKAEFLLRNREGETIESIYGRAGIYAEFGKIICISCGSVQGSGDNKKLLLKSFFSDDEKSVLSAFCEMLNKWAIDNTKYLCAHNGKEFDFPFLSRRHIINNICIPSVLDMTGKKPWDVQHLDTLELWKFGEYKNYTSLNLLAQTLGITTPKDDIDGSMVWKVYWEEKDLSRIVHYCQKDVVTLVQIFLRLNADSLIQPENIEIK